MKIDDGEIKRPPPRGGKIYSDKQITELIQERENLFRRVRPLYERYCERLYFTDKGKEFASQGFARRLEIIAMCVSNVFDIIPAVKDLRDIPSDADALDAAINIQASLINVFGSIDNLAWVWVEERKLLGKDNKELDRFEVGLGAKCKIVRDSFSTEFRDHLKTLDKWFDAIGSYRDGLAHRIPLYVSTRCLMESDQTAYDEVLAKREAAYRSKNFAEYERLNCELEGLYVFQPYFKGSFTEQSGVVAFHFQLLSNLKIVLDLGEKITGELDSLARTRKAPKD